MRAPRALATLRVHFGEARFWLVQAEVLAVTALHVGVEWAGIADRDVGAALGLHHIPVALYVLPVLHAGLAYGREGGMLTGVWVTLLVLPTLFAWHASDFAWLGELLFVGIVVGIGLVVTVPVERERRGRERAVSTAGRLRLMNELVMTLSRPGSLREAVDGALGRVTEVMDLARVTVRGHDGTGTPFVIEAATADRQLPTADHQSLVIPLADGETGGGELTAAFRGALSSDDRDLLSAVASQIGVALENSRFHEAEQRGLRAYAHEVTRAQEEERNRIARELHDDAAQAMVALCRGLDELASRSAWPDREQRAVDGLRTLGVEILESIRRLSRDLRPTVLNDLGLVPALEWLTTDAEQRAGIPVAFELGGTHRRLGDDVELAVFRIAQEALRNAAEHARASTITLSMQFSEHRLTVSVTDDGLGFVPPDPLVDLTREGKLGMVGMQERARLIGGRLTVTSASERGTTVEVDLPLP